MSNSRLPNISEADLLRAENRDLRVNLKKMHTALVETEQRRALITQFLCTVLHKEHQAGRLLGPYEIEPDDMDACKIANNFTLDVQRVPREDGDLNAMLALRPLASEHDQQGEHGKDGEEA